MANFDFSTKLEILPPKINTKNNSPKMKRAINSALTSGMIKAAAYVEKDLKIALDNAMSSSTWDWPRTTLRSNGRLVSSPRDIVDTGALKRSLSIQQKNLKTKTSLTIKYNTPYAALAHYGGVIQPYGNRNANAVMFPGRPWIEATLKGTYGIEKFNMGAPMNAGFNEVWSKRFG